MFLVECTTKNIEYNYIFLLLSKSFMLNHSFKGNFFILGGKRKASSLDSPFFGIANLDLVGIWLLTLAATYRCKKVWERLTILNKVESCK